MKTKINHTRWKSITLAVTAPLLMSGVASAGPTLINISGTVVYCSNPNLDPVPNVTLTVTGDVSLLTVTDGSGNYTFSVPPGGNYVVTPSKADLAPGSPGINSPDVIAVTRHVRCRDSIFPYDRDPSVKGRVAEMEHRAVPCAATGHSVWCIGFSRVKLRWPHRLQVCVPFLGNTP